MSYNPLPENLTIKSSDIHGLGLYAIEDIPKGTGLGKTHLLLNDEIIRTPLGGFYNHSEDPNCTKVEIGRDKYLIAINDISKGEEITVKYTFYDIEEIKPKYEIQEAGVYCCKCSKYMYSKIDKITFMCKTCEQIVKKE